MRARRTYRPTLDFELDAALETRTALSTIVPGMVMTAAHFQSAAITRAPAPAIGPMAVTAAPERLVLAGTLAPHVFVAGSLGTGTSVTTPSTLASTLASTLTRGLTTTPTTTAALNNATTSLGTILNTAFTGLGSSLNTGTFSVPSPVTQFIAGIPITGTTTTGSTTAGATVPMSSLGTTFGTTAFAGNPFTSSVFATTPLGMGFFL